MKIPSDCDHSCAECIRVTNCKAMHIACLTVCREHLKQWIKDAMQKHRAYVFENVVLTTVMERAKGNVKGNVNPWDVIALMREI